MIRRHRPNHQRVRGFTLIELVATITILGALGTVGASIMFSAFDGYLTASTSSQLFHEGSVALDRVTRVVRSIGLDTTALATAPDIDSVTASSITWDVDDSFQLVGDELRVVVGGGTPAVLVDDVTAFQIRVFDGGNNAISLPASGGTCDAIRRVEFEITLSRNGESATLRTRVAIRSTMMEV